MTDERSSQLYLENCIQREISYENKRVELIQQDIRGNVNNINLFEENESFTAVVVP